MKKELDFIFAPVGGGGLLSGTALAAKKISRRVRVWSVPSLPLADDAARSLKSGKIEPACPPQSIADGLLTGGW